MLEKFYSTIQNVIMFTWPTIAISIVILVSVRVAYLIKSKEKFAVYQELLMLCFAIYILCLFQVVTFQDDTAWASNNFIPFREIMRYSITSRLFLKNVLGNMIMFLPFGFFISYYLKSDRVNTPLLLTFIASIAIELVQMSIGRVFDVDDILLNLIGGLLGYFVYRGLVTVGDISPKFFHNDTILGVFMILVIIGISIALYLIMV